jgi:hypothetical protein
MLLPSIIRKLLGINMPLPKVVGTLVASPIFRMRILLTESMIPTTIHLALVDGLGRHSVEKIKGHRSYYHWVSTVCRYSDKPNYVYSQHERYFATQKDDRDPRRAFFEDLDHDMHVWLVAGNLIVLGLDANEHVRQGTTLKFINRWGLVDVHADRHSHLYPVATQDTNKHSVPVDGLWCSPGLPITAAGMTGFGEIKINNADHRMLWVDLPNEFLFGFCPPSLPTITPSRLNLHNPKVISRYNKIQKKRRDNTMYWKRFSTFKNQWRSGLGPM